MKGADVNEIEENFCTVFLGVSSLQKGTEVDQTHSTHRLPLNDDLINVVNVTESRNAVCNFRPSFNLYISARRLYISPHESDIKLYVPLTHSRALP
jgi:hypothetical protein